MLSVHQNICQLEPAKFQAETLSVLAACPVQSRRVISRLADAHESPDSFRLFAVYQGDVSVGALCYELRKSYICAAGTITVEAARSLLASLSDEFGEDLIRPHGCDGPPLAVDSLALACEEAFHCCVCSTDCMETMILDTEPRLTSGVPGMLRQVSPCSKLLPILAMWFEQFEKDTDTECYSLDGRQEVVAHLAEVASRKDLFTWEVKEKPVAMAIMGRTHPKQLLCVYTPQHQRGRGFGQAVTAAVCSQQWQTMGGKEPITLSAVHKFGAARIYERVGFRSAGWLQGVTFADACCSTRTSSTDFSAVLAEKSNNADPDVDTDVGTDSGGNKSGSDTDAETEAEAHEVADEEADWDVDGWDLEDDPATLFASSNVLFACI